MARTKTISNEDLLEVARNAFIEVGFSASSKEIARRAGVSEGVLFQRFITKEELFFASMTPPPVDLKDIFEHPKARGQALLEKITFAMIDYFRILMPVLIPLMSHPSFRFEDFARRQPDSPLATLRRQLVEFLMAEKRAGFLGAIDPPAAAFVIWSTAHSVAFFERLGAHDGEMPKAIIRSTVQCMWTGMKPASDDR